MGCGGMGWIGSVSNRHCVSLTMSTRTIRLKNPGRSVYRGLRILIPAAIVAVAAQAINVLLPVGEFTSVLLQGIVFLAWLVGSVGLIIHYRQMWQLYSARRREDFPDRTK